MVEQLLKRVELLNKQIEGHNMETQHKLGEKATLEKRLWELCARYKEMTGITITIEELPLLYEKEYAACSEKVEHMEKVLALLSSGDVAGAKALLGRGVVMVDAGSGDVSVIEGSAEAEVVTDAAGDLVLDYLDGAGGNSAVAGASGGGESMPTASNTFVFEPVGVVGEAGPVATVSNDTSVGGGTFTFNPTMGMGGVQGVSDVVSTTPVGQSGSVSATSVGQSGSGVYGSDVSMSFESILGGK